MDDESARQLLRTGNHRERLSAARFLLGRVQPSDRTLIRTAARKEDDQYVRAALLRLLVALPPESAGLDTSARTDAPTEIGDERSRIVREVTNQLTHEIATIVAALRHYARREVGGFEASETRRELDRLAAVLVAMRQLGDAATPPTWEKVEVSRLAKGILDDEKLIHSYEALMYEGEEPHVFVASQGHLSLFLRNAIANAIEATLELHGQPRAVVVTWGSDDREHWLAVLDDGPGPPGSLETFRVTGASTKDGHPGMGLTIADQVASTLGGQLSLSPQERGGAVCRLAWPRRALET
jgi:signal transduction histidine kinase